MQLLRSTKRLRPLLLVVAISCGLMTSAQADPIETNLVHAVNRLSFGARPGELEQFQQIGFDRYLQQQLSPDTLPEPQNLTDQLSQLETLQQTPTELQQQYSELQKGDRKAARQLQQHVMQQAAQARLLRAIESPRQLQEVMVDFWFNHFNVDANKGRSRLWIASYDQIAIRPNVLGRFRDLLGATAHHPAMLFYLDNWQNTAPNSPGAKGRFQGLNENYARELMELHTLGVQGGYTQQDVITLAKILTGWGIARPNQGDRTGFYFDAKRHDFSNKVFLDQAIKGVGEAEGEQALDILSKSPATARHISFELAQYFVSDQPPVALVDRLTQRYLETDGNIRSMLETLFRSPEFSDAKTYQAKFKTPYQYVLSSLRGTGTRMDQMQPIAGLLRQLGMPLFNCPTPDGYANTQSAWLNPDAMTRRLSFATALTQGQFAKSSGAIVPQVDASQLQTTIGYTFSPNTQSAIAASPPALRAAVLLGSPEFMYR